MCTQIKSTITKNVFNEANGAILNAEIYVVGLRTLSFHVPCFKEKSFNSFIQIKYKIKHCSWILLMVIKGTIAWSIYFKKTYK